MSAKITPKPQQQFFSIGQVSEILGVSRFTIGRLISIKTLPVVKLQGRGRKSIIRISAKDLEELIEVSRTKSAVPPGPLQTTK